MIRRAWNGLSPFLQHAKRKVILLACVSLLVGLAEASVLVIVVHVALILAGNGQTAATTIPVINAQFSSGSLLWLAGAMGLLSVLGHFIQARVKAGTMSEVSASARSTAIAAFIGASWNRQAQDREGALQETMSTLVDRLSAMTGCLVTGAAAVVNLGAFLLIAAFVNPVAMVVVLVFGAVLSTLMRPLSKINQRRSGVYGETNSRFLEEISRTTSLAMEYRTFGVETIAADHLKAMAHQTARHQYSSRVSAAFSDTLYRDLAALFLVAALTAMYSAQHIAIASIGTVVVLIVRGLAYSQVVQFDFRTLRQDLPNLESFERRVGDLQAEVAVFGAVPITEIRSVEFCNVEYEYIPGSPSLRGVSLRLEPGEVVGIVGPSGGGKTTLVQVLLRLRTPSKGTVLINGRPYEEFDTGCWADLMAMVPQEPRLMEASLADNISFLRKGISRAQIEQAADDAHVGADIRRLVQGFDTKLGSRGYGLSGGQKQRVAIARALVGRPKLLVLDEPTSALDVNSERLLQETIATLKGSVTMVIVAHRLSTLDVCDRLLVLRDGQVEAFGCRADLERESDFYQSIIAGLGAPVEEGAT